MSKNLWCPKCQTFPNEVKEIYSHVIEYRKWNGSEYETEDVDYCNQEGKLECMCGETLKEKNEPGILSKMSGEISEDESVSPSE